jgi:hypothetical protein
VIPQKQFYINLFFFNTVILDYQTTNRKNRDSSPGASESVLLQLREALHQYRLEAGVFGGYPSGRMVREIMAAASGASEAQVIECLRVLREDRGLTPLHKHGPRSWAWFKAVVKDYFDQERARALPPAAAGTFDRAEFEAMTEFLELPDEDVQ